MCKTKYPELSEFYFSINDSDNNTYVEVKYKNNIKKEV